MLSTKTNQPKKPYTVADIARETGAKSPAIVRRILRAAAIERPANGGWAWPDKAAAKSALDAVQRVQKTEKK